MVNLPEPTRKEALALVVGTGGFWAGIAVAIPTLFMNDIVAGFIPLLFGITCGQWAYIGGCYHILGRAKGMPIWRLYFGIGQGGSWEWVGVFTPSYFKRSISVLGWSMPLVATTLLALFFGDVALVVALMTTTPQ